MNKKERVMMGELVILGVVIGAISGFFGIGGGTILVPLLMLLGFDIKSAIGISVVQMLFSSIYGSFLNYKRGSLLFDEGIVIGVGGFLGGFIGASLTHAVPNLFLEILLILILLFASAKLWIASDEPTPHLKSYSTLPLVSLGVVIGSFSIMLGIGGSILLTPILVGLFGYSLKKAVSAGLFFVIFSSTAGVISLMLGEGEILYQPSLLVALSSLVGVALGVWAKERIKTLHHKILLLLLYGFSIALLLSHYL
jgi:uncharacterized membrane protein YfcA